MRRQPTGNANDARVITTLFPRGVCYTVCTSLLCNVKHSVVDAPETANGERIMVSLFIELQDLGSAYRGGESILGRVDGATVR
jgi:hypothetical protein